MPRAVRGIVADLLFVLKERHLAAYVGRREYAGFLFGRSHEEERENID
jgi:hypothetical protein